jgi:hypothetical protein
LQIEDSPTVAPLKFAIFNFQFAICNASFRYPKGSVAIP